ncbi:MAG: hypothetical protein U0457_02410 [Candidatus Sericytochromatia bacterium]
MNTEEQPVKTERTQEEKMKRMRTALKSVAGWFSYLMGNLALMISIFNPWGLEIMSFSFGVIIITTSLFLLFKYTTEKKLEGLLRVSRILKFLGGFIFIPSFIAYKLVTKDLVLNNQLYYLALIGIVLIFSSILVKKYHKKQLKVSSS